MPEHVTRQGDTFQISGTLRDAEGNRVDISGATLEFGMAPIGGGALLIDFEAADNDQAAAGTEGDWSYEETPLSVFPADLYEGYVRVTFGDGTVQTFPNDDFPGDGPILVRITAELPVAETVPFATSADLEERLGIALTSAEHKRGHALLLSATGLVQAEAGQTLSFLAGDTLTRPGVWGPRLRLAQRPVIAVNSVSLDGTELDADGYYLDGAEIVRTSGWGGPQVSVAVDYDHGYNPLPEVLKTIALEAVVRVWVNPGAVLQETSGGQVVSYLQPGGLLLRDEERNAIRRLIGSQVGTLTLR